jgi:Uma2 family endonuclease
MATSTTLMTVAEYEKLESPGDGRYELRHGEVVKVTFPVFDHVWLQHRLQKLLSQLARDSGFVMVELPFRPGPEHELWGADVAYLTRARAEHARNARWLLGSPEIVIEILSPSNTASEMLDRERTCMAGGCIEFWTVDPKLRLVRVTRNDGTVGTYAEADRIPLRLFGEESLSVNEIFAES